MPRKELFENIHGFRSQPPAPFVFMVINPHRKPRRKLPYVELRGRRSLPGYGVRGCCPERQAGLSPSIPAGSRATRKPTHCPQGGAETRWGANRTGSVGALLEEAGGREQVDTRTMEQDAL